MATAINATLLADAKTAAANAGAEHIAAGHDAGATAGYVELRKGTAPAVGAAATGALIVTITLDNPSHQVPAVAGVCNVAGAPSGVAVAAEADVDTNGVWFRAYDGDDTVVGQGDVAFTDAGEEMIIDTNAIAIDDVVTIVTYDITAGVT